VTDDKTLERFREWIGRTEERVDEITVAPLVSLAALLDRDDPPPRAGDAAPPLAHWLYFLPSYRQSQAGPDGHAARGEFLPPVPLPRRMWAGSRLEFAKPLRVGSRVRRLSRIVDVVTKHGRSGALVFVTVRHEVSDEAGLVLSDEHDIVYRGESGATPPATPAPTPAAWQREIHPDPLLLFRYSAVTFNGHRIHYDQPYVTQVEGYPGLVVHGPLTSTLLIDFARDHARGRALASFEAQARAPLFDTAALELRGRPSADGRAIELWAATPDGTVAMSARADLA